MGFSEEELKALQELNEKIVETAPIGIHVVDRDFTVRSWNSYLENYTSIKKEDIIGKNLFKVLPGLLRDGWDKEYEKVIGTGEPFEKLGHKYTRSIGPKKGEVLYQNSRIAPPKTRRRDRRSHNSTRGHNRAYASRGRIEKISLPSRRSGKGAHS